MWKVWFFCILKVTAIMVLIKIQIRIRICSLEVRIRRSVSVPKCHGSGTPHQKFRVCWTVLSRDGNPICKCLPGLIPKPDTITGRTKIVFINNIRIFLFILRLLLMFGKDSDQNRIAWGNPQKWFQIPCLYYWATEAYANPRRPGTNSGMKQINCGWTQPYFARSAIVG